MVIKIIRTVHRQFDAEDDCRYAFVSLGFPEKNIIEQGLSVCSIFVCGNENFLVAGLPVAVESSGNGPPMVLVSDCQQSIYICKNKNSSNPFPRKERLI